MHTSKLNSSFFSLLVFICLSITSNAQNEYYPLKKGSTYIYKYEATYSAQPDQKSKIEIHEKTETINGKEYLKITTSMGSDKNGYNTVQTNHARDKGNGEIVGFQNGGKVEKTVFPAQLTVGTTWEYQDNEITITSKVVAHNTTVNTPHKAYTNCVAIQVDFGNAATKVYLQKGVGMVAISMIINGEEKLMQYLIDYQL